MSRLDTLVHKGINHISSDNSSDIPFVDQYIKILKMWVYESESV